MTVLLASLGVGAAVWLSGRARPRLLGHQIWRHAPLVGVGLATGVVVLRLEGRWLVVGLFAVALAAAVRWLVQRRRAAKRAAEGQERVLRLCEAFAAELAAGLPPLRVAERAGAEFAEFAELAQAVRVGAEVPATLRRMALVRGHGDLRLVAAAWEVAGRSGSGLAEVMSRMAQAIAQRRATAALADAELASTRATAGLMAVLPVGTLALAGSLGGDPVGFLTGTTPGLICLGAGLGLVVAGLAWLQHIEASVGGP